MSANGQFNAPKTVEQQDIQSLLCIREHLVENCTINRNQLRGFLAEYGLIIAKTRRQLMLSIPLMILARNLLTTLRNRDLVQVAQGITAETGLEHRPVRQWYLSAFCHADKWTLCYVC